MGEFIIPINIGCEKEIYSEFDPSGLAFSSDLTAYLSDYIEDRKLGEQVCIEVRSKTEPDMERLRKAFLLFADKLSRRNKRETIKSKFRVLRLLLIGILFIVVSILTESLIGQVLAVIISTIGSFSVWEASAVWIETLPELRKRDRILRKMSDTEFRYVRGDGK